MILDDIVEHKRRELQLLRDERPLASLMEDAQHAPPARDFTRALRPLQGLHEGHSPRIIAEIKRASPSRGVMCSDFDPVCIARSYESCGAAAISVVTDRHFFQGEMEYLRLVRDVTTIPLLNKDFIIDSYQIYRARVYGADAVLLIAAILSRAELSHSLQLVNSLGMSALVEVHTSQELDMALATDAEIIGINNRDLKTFSVTVDTTRQLLASIPAGRIVVSESGINSREIMLSLARQGVHAFLIGEALMQSPDRETTLRLLLS